MPSVPSVSPQTWLHHDVVTLPMRARILYLYVARVRDNQTKRLTLRPSVAARHLDWTTRTVDTALDALAATDLVSIVSTRKGNDGRVLSHDLVVAVVPADRSLRIDNAAVWTDRDLSLPKTGQKAAHFLIALLTVLDFKNPAGEVDLAYMAKRSGLSKRSLHDYRDLALGKGETPGWFRPGYVEAIRSDFAGPGTGIYTYGINSSVLAEAVTEPVQQTPEPAPAPTPAATPPPANPELDRLVNWWTTLASACDAKTTAYDVNHLDSLLRATKDLLKARKIVLLGLYAPWGRNRRGSRGQGIKFIVENRQSIFEDKAAEAVLWMFDKGYNSSPGICLDDQIKDALRAAEWAYTNPDEARKRFEHATGRTRERPREQRLLPRVNTEEDFLRYVLSTLPIEERAAYAAEHGLEYSE